MKHTQTIITKDDDLGLIASRDDDWGLNVKDDDNGL